MSVKCQKRTFSHLVEHLVSSGGHTQRELQLVRHGLVRSLHYVLLQAFAHEVNVISQAVQHARIGDRHSQMVGLFR
jgi:hypothetical protein